MESRFYEKIKKRREKNKRLCITASLVKYTKVICVGFSLFTFASGINFNNLIWHIVVQLLLKLIRKINPLL